MNSSSYECETAALLSKSTQLRAMLILREVAALTGLVLFAILFRVQGTKLALHKNAKILLVSHHIWTILHSIANLIVHTSSLIRLALFLDNPCEYLMTMLESILFRGQMVLTMYGQIWALAAMAIERGVATANYRKYEKTNGTLGTFLVAAEWFLSILWFYLAIRYTNWSDVKAYATVTSSTTGMIFSNLMISLAVVEASALASFYGILWYNNRRRAKLGSSRLTEKYQIDENVRATRLMIPMVWTHFACFMPTFIAFPIYTMRYPSLNPHSYPVFLETFNLVPFYSVALPVVLLWRYKVLRTNLRNALDVRRIFPSAPRNDGLTHEQVHHFEILRQTWSRR